MRKGVWFGSPTPIEIPISFIKCFHFEKEPNTVHGTEPTQAFSICDHEQKQVTINFVTDFILEQIRLITIKQFSIDSILATST